MCAKLKLVMPASSSVTYRIFLDKMPPYEIQEGKKETVYTFETSVGEHRLVIESVPKQRNQLGKLYVSVLSASFQKRIVNHLFAFRYELTCFHASYRLHMHRNAEVKIALKRRFYNNFLYTKASYLYPVLVNSTNVKPIETTVSILHNAKLKKRFYLLQALLWTLYFLCLMTLLGGFGLYDVMHWENGVYLAGFHKSSAFFLGVLPPIVLTLFSYIFCLQKLVKQYKEDFLCK